jgi:hypothetical protein
MPTYSFSGARGAGDILSDSSDIVSLAGSRDDSKVLQITLSTAFAEYQLIWLSLKSLALGRGQVCSVPENCSDNRP